MSVPIDAKYFYEICGKNRLIKDKGEHRQRVYVTIWSNEHWCKLWRWRIHIHMSIKFIIKKVFKRE